MQSQSDKIHAIANAYINCIFHCKSCNCHNCDMYYKIDGSYSALTYEEQLEVDNIVNNFTHVQHKLKSMFDIKPIEIIFTVLLAAAVFVIPFTLF